MRDFVEGVRESKTWIKEFLGNRSLTAPDERPLYAYRCTEEEFAELRDLLSHRAPFDGRVAEIDVRAFVLYASEWWQREYDGGHWAWEPLLESVYWSLIPYHELYQPVRRAWQWWRIQFVRLPSSVRYLGTFACQGGLPLALVGSSRSNITLYLRAVLKHTAAYRRFVDDPVELAEDQQHLLRPPTLRRDYVFRLASDLVQQVLKFKDDVEVSDPLGSLDGAHPHWRDDMPVDLGDDRAQELLTGLLREAARTRTSTTEDFRVNRFLRHTQVGWRVGANVQLPGSISHDGMARQLKTESHSLPHRLEVRLEGNRVRVLGLYFRRNEDFSLSSTSRTQEDLWGAEAINEIRIQFLAGHKVGESLVPRQGSNLSGLPWVFRIDDDERECPFVGEGSVSNRAKELFVLTPSDSSPVGFTDTMVDAPSEEVEGSAMRPKGVAHEVDRLIWRIGSPIGFESESGMCKVRPSSGHTIESEFRLIGDGFYDLECTWPLFRGHPSLQVTKSDQLTNRVRRNEVNWRKAGGDWQIVPDSYGLWEIRHLQQGELRYLGRAGILPSQFEFDIRPGSAMNEGSFQFSNAEGLRIDCGDAETAVTESDDGGDVCLHVSAKETTIPSHMSLGLHWRGGAEINVRAPFPGQGARFLRDGEALEGQFIADDLYGARVVALSPTKSDSYWLEGELRAPELGNLLRHAHFRVQLMGSGILKELALIDVRPVIDLLLSASSLPSAAVKLRILDGAQKEYATAMVSRRGSWEMLAIESPALINEQANTPLMSSELRDADNHIHQTVSGIEYSSGRMDPIAEAVQRLASAQAQEQNEEDWSLLNESLLAAEELPLPEVGFLRSLVKQPTLLVRAMFRLETVPRKVLWRLEDELPFSWLLIRRSAWRSEAHAAYKRTREQLSDLSGIDAEEVSRSYIESIFEEAEDRLPSLSTVSTDVILSLCGAEISGDLVGEIRRECNNKLGEQIGLRASLNDWPKGYGRDQWTEVLKNGDLLDKRAIWLDTQGHHDRKPCFDTPVAAAWCCFFSDATESTTFLVKRMRAHDVEWFDLAYSAAWYYLAHWSDQLRNRR